MTNTLAEALPKEIQRVQELLPLYDAIPTGIFAGLMMRNSINAAYSAMMSGDVLAMLRCHEDLKGYSA